MSKFGINLLAPLLLCVLSCASHSAAVSPVVGDPLKGVIVGDDVVTCVLVNGDVAAYVHSLGKDQQTRGRWCTISDGSPLRWQIGHGAFWVSFDWNFSVPPRLPNLGSGCLRRIDMTVFSKGEDIFHRDDANFSHTSPTRPLAFGAYSSKYFLYFDYLPAGKFQAREFIATNLTSKHDDRERDFENGKSPSSIFRSYIVENHWDAKKGAWKEQPWKLEWSTPASFKEPFQALALGDDFYFVTRSGSLFRAAKPAKGTDRVLARVWDGRSRPIKAFITDAKTGKSFLFVPPAKEGGKRAFFELSDKPKLVEYDPKLVPLPPLEEPHRTIVHAARILVALNKIAGKLPAKVGKE